MSLLPQHRIRLTGAPIAVSNAAPVDLTDPDSLYVVTAGELVVFATATTGGRPGRRHFLVAAGVGEAAAGVAVTDGLALSGTGTVGTQVQRIRIADLSDDRGEAEDLIAGWARGLAEGVERHRSAGDPLPLHGPAAGSVEAPVPPVLDPTGWGPLPDGPATWGREALSRLAVLIAAGDRAARDRMIDSRRSADRVGDQALAGLAATLTAPVASAATVGGHPLVQTCRTVAQYAGVVIVEPQVALSGELKPALRQIAKSSQLRIRRVLLDGDWFPAEAGPMLAIRVEDRTPVALVPSRGGGYVVVDHGRGTREPLDAALAAQLAPEAYVLYSSWPTTPLAIRHVVGLGMRRTRGDLLRIVGFGLASALLALLVPVATATLFNEIIPTAATDRLTGLIVVLVLGALAGAGFTVAQGVALIRVETRFNESVGTALWDRVLRLPVPFFRLYSVGDLAQRTLAVDAIRQVLAQAGFSVVLSAVFSLCSLALLFVYDPGLAGIALVLLAVQTAVTVGLTTRQVRLQRDLLALRGEVAGLVVQQVSGVAKLRVAAAEGQAFARWAAVFAQQQQAARAATVPRTLQTVFTLAWVPTTTAVLFAALMARGTDAIDPGSFLAFFAAFGQILVAGRAVTGALGGLLTAVPLYERARPILDATPEVVTDAQDPGALTGALEVSHVDFRYDPDGPLILRDVSLSVAAGEFVAVVGPSGAGKSSLIRLLLGFETPEAGAILLDGQNLGTLDVELVRRQIGVVLQTAQLFPGSILTNIVGEAELSRDDAWAAAAHAGLDADLRAMPMGIDTLITEGSSTLSGGQRQRLLIARALARRPRYLLFDEATSALDNLTQRTVTESLQRLAVTRVVIAHRLSTIVNADRIIVMERGQVVEVGTYAELMAAGGPFAELASRQIG